MRSNIEVLNNVEARVAEAKRERAMINEFMANRTNTGSYTSTRVRRMRAGSLLDIIDVDDYRYISVIEGDDDWEGLIIVRDNKTTEPRVYREILRWSKDDKSYTPKQIDINDISLRRLPMFRGIHGSIEDMFDNIKLIKEDERLYARAVEPGTELSGYEPDGSIRATEVESAYQGQLCEWVTYSTYKAKFGSREIVYTKSNLSPRIFNVKLLSVYVAEEKARLKWQYDIANSPEYAYQMIEKHEKWDQEGSYFEENQGNFGPDLDDYDEWCLVR